MFLHAYLWAKHIENSNLSSWQKIKDYASTIKQNNFNFVIISNFRDYLTMLYQL
jgi:hypothetical protein